MSGTPATKILLLNLDAGRTLVLGLEEILRESTSARFQVTEMLVSASGIGNGLKGRCGVLDQSPDCILLCVSQPNSFQVETTSRSIHERFREAPVVFVAESGEPMDLNNLFNLGAADFVIAPLRANDVVGRLLRLHRPSKPDNTEVSELKERLGLKQFVGESEILLREIRKIPKVARYDASVLIGGETGTGKEMVARAIHGLSPRSAKPFVPVNCGAIPRELIENELFGHEAGAFTSASSSTAGLIHDAEGGTVFLDEIDSLPMQSQVKLLRFLQDKEFRPLGSRKTLTANVRVISASNANVRDSIRTGRFRSDLYFRLNVIPLLLPSLRERMEDLPLLVRHLVAKYSAKHGLTEKPLSNGAFHKLIEYQWPGNVRELENIIEQAIILSEESLIRRDDIRLPATSRKDVGDSFKVSKARVIGEFESRYIRQLLSFHNGNVTKAASAAKKNRRAFWQLMVKYGINS